MVQVGEEVKFHDGCFLANPITLMGRPWSFADCAESCNEDELCKGFTVGKGGPDYLGKAGCVFATTKTDCESTRGHSAFNSQNYTGDLLKEHNIGDETMEILEQYGYSGCYMKDGFSK